MKRQIFVSILVMAVIVVASTFVNRWLKTVVSTEASLVFSIVLVVAACLMIVGLLTATMRAQRRMQFLQQTKQYKSETDDIKP